MAIGRMQMNRQLYGLGSYFPPENGREKFGLGSKLKKFVRNIIPNEVADIAVKAAPFVAPFNPLLAGYMAGIGGFDQTGSIGSSLKRGLLTYGGGQLARGIGGAGFQQGFNPLSNVSFSGGIMSGLGQTFTSPVSGAPMFGQAQFAPDPNQLTPTQQAITSGTGDIDSYESIRDYQLQTRPNPVTKDLTASEMAQQAGKTLSERTATTASRGYMDITKDLFSGDFTKMGNAATELGGKALKDIYTNPITNQAGDVVGSKLDKTALLATLVTIPSYLDAKKAADDAGLEGFDEATYNAERDKYMSRYQANLPASSFGIESKATGGRIGYKQGTPREGIVSLTDEDSGVIYRDPDTEEPITKEEFLRRTQEDEDRQYMSPTDQGSGVIYRDEKGNPISKEEWLRLSSDAPSITLPEKETKGMKKYKYESDPYLLQLMRKTGEDVFFFGEPNPELNYREFDKMPMDYQNKVEDKREGRRRFYQKYDYKQAPRYERMGYADGDIASGLAIRLNRPVQPGDPIGSYYGGTPIMISNKKVEPTLNRDSQGRLVNSITGQPITTLLPLNRESMSEPTAAARSVDTTRGSSVNQLFNYYRNKEMDEARRQQIIDLFMRDNAATGGRMGYAMGSEVPVRRNEGGITELDYRKTGGFVPVGVKERADDVPAMLSKNEFVFTADAVRAAGGGSVQKGAQKMYNTMKMLEGKLV
jgi:hypothetical protein